MFSQKLLDVAQPPQENQKHNFAYRSAIWLLGLATLAYLCAVTVADPDLWGHTLYGLRAMEQGQLVEPHDPFSFTAVSAKWVNHEWLSEYYMGWLFANAGNAGLWWWRTFWALVVVCVLGNRWASSRDLHLSAALLTFSFAAIALRGFFVFVRPQLATLGLFAVTLAMLHAAWHDRRKMESSPWLWSLVPIIAAWTNFHGGFVAGVAIVWFYALGALAQSFVYPEQRRGAIRLCVIAVCCSWATVLNPYGVGLHQMLWQHLAPHQDVIEWEPLWRNFSLPLLLPLLLVLMSISVLVTRIRSRTRSAQRNGVHGLSWMDLAACSVCLYQAVSHRRHVALLAIAVVILLAVPISTFMQVRFSRVLAKLRVQRRLAFGGFALGVIGLVALRVPSVVEMNRAGIGLLDVAVRTTEKVPGVPLGAVSFLRRAGIGGNVVTDYGWGQFVIWHLHPQMRVAFDGRYRTIYPTEVERHFLDFVRHPGTSSGTLRLLTNYPTDVALLPSDWPVARRLERDANWQRVYKDHHSVVFMHRNRLNASTIERLEQAASESLQPATWVAFPGQSRQVTLAAANASMQLVSNVEQSDRKKRIVQSLPLLAREVQLKVSPEFVLSGVRARATRSYELKSFWNRSLPSE